MLQSMFSPFHLAMAFTPLALYLLMLAFFNCRRRPTIMTGGRDALTLAAGLSGFIAAGPLELFMPIAAANQFGGYVWLLLISLYVLTVLLVVLLMKPRIIVYNCTVEQIRPLLAKCVAELDAEARWAGECLMLPQSGIQLHVQANRTLRNVQLTAVGAQQSLEGWRNLYASLRQPMRSLRGHVNLWAPLFFLLAATMLVVAGRTVATHQRQVADTIEQTFTW